MSKWGVYGTAAEQFDENWLRSRHFFVTRCSALVTLDDALAYAAHVREAAQREIAKLEKELEVCALAREVHIKRAEAASRILADEIECVKDWREITNCPEGKSFAEHLKELMNKQETK